MIEDWLDDPDKVKEKAGLGDGMNGEFSVFDFLIASDAVAQVSAEDANKILVCEFCTETVPYSDTLALSCGHRYCTTCWSRWVLAEFDKGPQAVFTTCPSFKYEFHEVVCNCANVSAGVI